MKINTPKILTVPIDLEFDLIKKELVVNSKFLDKNYRDTVLYSSEGDHVFNLNNLYNFVEYEMIQQNIQKDDITKEIECGFITLINDILSSLEHVKKLTDKTCTKWKNKAGVVVHDGVVSIGAHLSKVDFLSSNFPCLNFMNDNVIHSITEAYVCKNDGVAVVCDEEKPSLFFEF